MNIKWDASKYREDFSFVPQYGGDLINLIDSAKGSMVLDLGCGNGTLTNELFKRGFNVIGLDASEAFLESARENYPEIDFIRGDAIDFNLDEPVDVVFSNAVFHWIDKESQSQMLKHVHEALKEGGEFVFEFGGYGCTNTIHETIAKVFSEYGYKYVFPFYFPTISEYATLLEENGFRVVFAHLFDRPTALKGEDGLKNWIKMFLKAPFKNVKKRDEEEIIERAQKLLRDKLYVNGTWFADYVRIRMKTLRL